IVKSLKFTWYQLPRALAEVFMPALDVVESSPNPTGGYYFNRYDLNQGRTHYPIAVPKMEIGRYIGNSPFTIEFFGQVDDELFRSSLIQDENGNEEHQEDIEVIWNGHYVLDLLKQPQSHTLITQIGELSKREKILSPYCGFVAPSMNGYQGFQRLTQIASAVEETIAAESVPESFAPIAFPNPFNAQTTLKIEIRPAPNNRLAQFEIIDVLGRIVKHVEIPLSADEDEITFVWDGQDSGGVPVSTGIYFVRCLLGNQQSLIKLTLVK
ncbi:MAG: T9SS C-terminal target domain-containing protein, partial [Calditrichaeota bacterium]